MAPKKRIGVKAHILVCFLGLMCSGRVWLSGCVGSGLGDAPRTLLEEFAKIKSGDVVLPARTSDGRKAKTVRLRCVTAPDQAQKVLLHRLGLNLPQRLRRIDEAAQM